MTGLLLAPPVLSLLVLGAHFFRAGSFVGVGATLALVAIAFIRRRWAARTVQVALVLGAIEWVRTAVQIGIARAHDGQPWLRMAVILAAVAVVTGLSTLAIRTDRLRRFYGIAV